MTHVSCLMHGVAACALAATAAASISSAAAADNIPNVKVIREVRHATLPSLRDVIAKFGRQPEFTTALQPVIPLHRLPLSTTGHEQDAIGNGVLPSAPNTTDGLNFEGVDVLCGCAPPDTNGAVGATQYVQWVNLQYNIYDKSNGALVAGPINGNALWLAAFGKKDPCGGNNSGDPIAQYDKAAGRWVLMQPVFTAPYYMCVAVSQTNDATGAYNLYEFAMGSTEFPDYPKLAIWPASGNEGYFLTVNEFKNGITFDGAGLCGMDRTSMLAGAAATMQCFQTSTSFGGLLPGDFDGTLLPPAGADENFANFSGSSTIDFWRMHVDFVNPSNTTLAGPNPVIVPSFSPLCGNHSNCVPQQGTPNKLDSLGDRLMYRLAYRNFGDHESLVTNHSVTVSKRGAVRWYEFQNPSSPTLFQSGNVGDSSLWYWMGSIGMDKGGNIAVGFSTSSSKAFPSINYAGRAPSDPAGSMSVHASPTTAGGGSQTGSLHRWGDYSAISIDPTDDCTFYYTQEYLQANGSFNWSTRVNSFKFNTCT